MKPFECRMCGECCYGEGGIHLNESEQKRLASFLNMDKETFLEGYCYQRHNRICIKTGQDGYCIFFHKEKNCLVHPVKPEICHLWPFYPANIEDKDSWELAKDACPGINPESTHEEFVNQYREQDDC